MEDLRVLVFFYIVEGALAGYVGMALLGFRLNLKQFAAVGVCQGLVVYLVRGIYTINGLPFGTHIFFTLSGMVIILYLFTRKHLRVCTLAAMLAFVAIYLGELLGLPIAMKTLGITWEQFYSDPWLHVALGYAGDWLLILAAIILFLSKKSLIDLKDMEL